MRIKSHMKPKLEEGGFPMMLSGFKVFLKKILLCGKNQKYSEG